MKPFVFLFRTFETTKESLTSVRYQIFMTLRSMTFFITGKGVEHVGGVWGIHLGKGGERGGKGTIFSIVL